VIIIYNGRGAFALLAGAGLGFVAHAAGAPMPLAVVLAAVPTGAHDLHHRLRVTEDLFTPGLGGMLYYAPIWLIASIAILIGGYLEVTRRGTSTPEVPAPAAYQPPVEAPVEAPPPPPTHQSLPLYQVVNDDHGVVQLGALTSSTALFEQPSLRLLIVASTTPPSTIARFGAVDAVALCESEAWNDIEARVDGKKLTRKKADALEDALADSRRFVVDDAAVVRLAGVERVVAVSDAVCPKGALPQVLACTPDGCGVTPP
jgi:hypothetical protein